MVIRTKRYTTELQEVLNFIAKGSIYQARKFKDDLDRELSKIEAYPLAYRKSILFDDESVRDFIFKKYVIPFWIVDDDILLLGIFKSNIWKP